MTTRTKRRKPTPVPVRFGEEEAALLSLLQARASAADRSVSGQLKHYARLAMIAEDNPDLPMAMIRGILDMCRPCMVSDTSSRSGHKRPQHDLSPAG